MTTLKMTVNTTVKKGHISPLIYGSFAEHLGRCIYDGIYVGDNSDIPDTDGIRNDIVEALKAIKLPVLRWPGGCFADEYHWRDGIGDKSKRKKMINTHWGMVIDDNSFGTHEFLRLCELIGCEPYIAGNVGSGTVREMAEWVEYLNCAAPTSVVLERAANGRIEPWKVKYFGIGNENWACGGNMRPEYYADLYRRYAVYCRNYGSGRLYKIACGPSSHDYNWTDKLMESITATKDCSAISLHHYCLMTNVRATELSSTDYAKTIAKAQAMDKIIEKHWEIMGKYDSDRRIKLVVDEWGTWYRSEAGTHPSFLHQQNTMTDAIVAAGTLDIFNNKCNIVDMANIAQTVNVLQSVILTSGRQLIKTPTYHVFDIYKEHQNNMLLESSCENRIFNSDEEIYAVSHSASLKPDGSVFLTLSNADPDKAYETDINLIGNNYGNISAEILVSDNYLSHNTFTEPEKIKKQTYTQYKLKNNRLLLTLPACSVVGIALK